MVHDDRNVLMRLICGVVEVSCLRLAVLQSRPMITKGLTQTMRAQVCFAALPHPQMHTASHAPEQAVEQGL